MLETSGTIKVKRFAGLYRSDTPEQIPTISCSDLVNFDIINDSAQSRKGYQADNTTPLQAGCLQFGYNSPSVMGDHYIKTKGGDFGIASTTHTTWAMFVYANEFAVATTAQTIVCATDPTDAFEILKLHLNTSGNIAVTVQPSSGDTPVTLEGAGSCTTANLYGVTITPATTAQHFTMSLYNYRGESASTIVRASGSFAKMDTLRMGSDRLTDNFFRGHMGELIFTKNEAVSTTVQESYNVVPPGSETAEANKIAYYPLHNDLEDVWDLSSDFRQSPVFKTGRGLTTYQVKDTILTSPQAENEITNNTSIHINTYDQDEYLYAKSGAVATTYAGYLNGADKSYTLTTDITPKAMTNTSTSFTLFRAMDGGPRITLRFGNERELVVEYQHVYDRAGTIKPTVATTIPMGRNAKLMFDYKHSGTTFDLRLYNNFALVKSNLGNSTTGETATTVDNIYYAYNQVGTTHDTTNVDIELYNSAILVHQPSVATTWTKKAPANIGQITGWKFGLVKRVVVNPITGKETIEKQAGIIYYTAIRDGADPETFNRFQLPDFANVFLMYLFTDFSEYEHITENLQGGWFLNAKDPKNDQNTALEIQNSRSPSWIIDRNEVGLVDTGYLNTEYMDEFDNSFSFLPTTANIGDKLILGSNSNLISSAGTTYNFYHVFRWHRKQNGRMRGLMYGNSLYIHNENMMFRYDGHAVNPVDLPTPAIQLSAVATTDGTGLNGAYMYTYTFTNKNGIESPPAPVVSTTVRYGEVALSLPHSDSISNIHRNSIDYMTIYRNKGSVGTATTLVSNNGTFFFKLEEVPYSNLIETGNGTLYTDKVDDTSLGVSLISDKNIIISPCKYSCLYKESGIFTGDPEAPNHYYISLPEAPELLDTFGEYRTEDGEENSGTAPIGSGFIIFKNSSRKFLRQGDELKSEELSDGGCVSHDSLVSLGDEVIGIGNGGFFRSNGSRYVDINGTYGDGREVSSIKVDVDSWSLATKQAAYAVYHNRTKRYICNVNDKMYIFRRDRNVWYKYEDFVGLPIIYQGDFYIFKRGWVWKEFITQAYVGDGAYRDSIVSGGRGYINVVSTTTLPTTAGLPIYIDNTYSWVRKVTNSGTTYTITVDSNVDFSSASKMYLGIMQAYAETKNFEENTPSKHKMFKRLFLEHDPVVGGEIEIRLARDSSAIDNDYNHFVGETDRGRIATWLRCYGKNIKLRYNIRDGKQHTLKSYTMPYTLKEYGY